MKIRQAFCRGAWVSPPLTRSGILAFNSLITLAPPLLLIALWQVAVDANWLHTQYIPSPAQVTRAFYVWLVGVPGERMTLYNGTWTVHALASARRVLAGFFAGSMAGVLVGFAIGWSRIAERMLDPLVQVLRPIPLTAWLPFVVVLLGIEDLSAVALISIGVFFPVTVNTVHGLRHVDRLLVRAAHMLGARGHRVLLRVGVPAALPAIFTGLRLGMGTAWVLVIVSEMVAVKSGFGYVMWDAYYYLRMDMIVAAMASVGVMGFLFDRLLIVVERQVCGWTRTVARTS